MPGGNADTNHGRGAGSASPGWYAVPGPPGTLRYWDGAQWTNAVHQPQPWQQRQQQPQPWSAPRHLEQSPSGPPLRLPWWQTWYAVVPGLLLCAPVGLIGLWMRKGTQFNLRVVLTIMSIGLLLVGAARSGTNSSTTQAILPVATNAAVTRPTTSPSVSSTPVAVAVPQLSGLTQSAAQSELTRLGLALGTVTARPSAQPVGTVLSQSAAQGTRIQPGTRVDLVVASALPTVPAVTGKSQTEATRILQAAGFVVSVTRETATQGVNGAVLRTSPSAGASVEPGSSIELVVLAVVAKVVDSAPNCTPGYSPCLPPASDYDCAGGSGDGPKYVRGPVYVTGSDPYQLDGNDDGVGCEKN